MQTRDPDSENYEERMDVIIVYIVSNTRNACKVVVTLIQWCLNSATALCIQRQWYYRNSLEIISVHL